MAALGEALVLAFDCVPGLDATRVEEGLDDWSEDREPV